MMQQWTIFFVVSFTFCSVESDLPQVNYVFLGTFQSPIKEEDAEKNCTSNSSSLVIATVTESFPWNKSVFLNKPGRTDVFWIKDSDGKMSCASQSYGILPPKSSCDTIPIDYVLCRQINMTQNSSTCINEIKDPESRDIFKVPVIVMFIVIPLAVLLAISALTYIYRRRRKIKSKTTEQTNSVKESDIVGEKDETKRGIEERYTERKANESGCDPVYIESYGQYDHLHLKRVHKEKTEKEENHYTGIDTPYQTTSAKNIELTLNEDMYTY